MIPLPPFRALVSGRVWLRLPACDARRVGGLPPLAPAGEPPPDVAALIALDHEHRYAPGGQT